VASGERVALSLSCAIQGHAWVEPESVRVRVCAALSGEILFEVGTDHLGVPLPDGGAFALRFDVQMNLPRGAYLLESFAWDRYLGRVSFVGPATSIEVREGSPFEGSVQPNATAALTAHAAGDARA
jgi:hypothetical protein